MIQNPKGADDLPLRPKTAIQGMYSNHVPMGRSARDNRKYPRDQGGALYPPSCLLRHLSRDPGVWDVGHNKAPWLRYHVYM